MSKARCAGMIVLTIMFAFAALFVPAFLEEVPELDASSRTLITAAHLGEIEGYLLVYVDEATDFAVYVQQDYTATGVSVGDAVSMVGTSATVISVDAAEFAVEVENISKIVPGVSGKPVYLNDTPIGFISGWNGEGAVRCIFY